MDTQLLRLTESEWAELESYGPEALNEAKASFERKKDDVVNPFKYMLAVCKVYESKYGRTSGTTIGTQTQGDNAPKWVRKKPVSIDDQRRVDMFAWRKRQIDLAREDIVRLKARLPNGIKDMHPNTIRVFGTDLLAKKHGLLLEGLELIAKGLVEEGWLLRSKSLPFVDTSVSDKELTEARGIDKEFCENEGCPPAPHTPNLHEFDSWLEDLV